MSDLPRPIRAALRDGVDETRLHEIWQRVETRRNARRFARRVLLPAFAVCGVVLSALSWLRVPPAEHTAPTAAREALALAGGEALSSATTIEVAANAEERVLRLSDGTRITLGSGGRLVPRASTAARLELVIERGRARFEVQPQRGRVFAVSAGGMRVEVVGTVFSVERGEREAAVSVEHGRVRVRAGDLPGGERILGAGESLRVPAPAAPGASDSAQTPAPTVTAEAAPPSATVASDVAPDVAPAPAARPEPVQVASPAFRAAVARGDYARAYALLGARGYARAVRQQTEIDALLQLADVARAAGKPHAAALSLSRIIELHPQGDRSALAALTLGRLELDVLGEPAAAVRALRAALAAGLPVALQEDALARLVDACARAGEQAAAARAAEQYRQRFPNGRWRASVEQWVNTR